MICLRGSICGLSGAHSKLPLDLILGKDYEFPQLGVKALRELELMYHIALTQNPELYLNCDPDQILNPHAYTVNLHFAEISKIRRQPVYATVCHRLREINHPKESQ